MELQNQIIVNYPLLKGMYDDGWFPNFLVDKIKAILLEMCHSIEAEKPSNPDSLLAITHAAVEKINSLEEEFEKYDSEFETEAREIMAANFDFIVKAYGFNDLDIEDVIAPREW